MVLVIDNFDSFTYNLVQALGALGSAPVVIRADAPLARIEQRAPERILISPGPKRPEEAGVSNDVIRRFAGRVPILGVCLGHQCIAQIHGARVDRAARIMHGKTSLIEHDGTGVYRTLPRPFTAMRYHSLIVDEASLPPELVATSRTPEGELMGIRHRSHWLEGVQFHPESYRTEWGAQLLKNFLNA